MKSYIGLFLFVLILWIMPVGDKRGAIQGSKVKGEGKDTTTFKHAKINQNEQYK